MEYDVISFWGGPVCRLGASSDLKDCILHIELLFTLTTYLNPLSIRVVRVVRAYVQSPKNDNNPILDTRISVFLRSSIRHAQATPAWILKWGWLESSGRGLIFLNGKTKVILLFPLFFSKTKTNIFWNSNLFIGYLRFLVRKKMIFKGFSWLFSSWELKTWELN